MRRILLIINPAAARTSKRLADLVVSVLQQERCQVEVVETRAHGDAERVARSGAEEGFDAFAVYGGDGTVMQVVAGAAGHDIPIGLIPGGTGNVLAGNLRLPKRPAQAAQVVARGETRTIDLGRMEQYAGTQYFAVACGSGFDAELMARTSGAAKRRWGFAAYVARTLTMLRALRPVPYKVTVDGSVLEVEATSLLIANCREIIPPILSFPPCVAVDDGLLDVVALRAHGAWQATRTVWKLIRGTVDGAVVRHARGREITVEAVPARPVQLDGEVAGETPFTVSIVRRGLSVFVPAASR